MTRGAAVQTGMSRIRSLVVGATVVALGALPVQAVAAPSEPELQDDRETLDAALDCPEPFVDTDRNPVLLVHGTGPTPRENFGWNLLPQLAADGYDVCTVELPTRALGDIQVAAEYVVHALREIHDRTGQRVDVAGHSQGGLEPRWALAWWPSTRELVGDLVTFASPHHGTVVTDVVCAASLCWPAVHQMRPGSAFLEALHAQEDLSQVEVTSLGSVMDELVQPPSTIELDDATNIILQDVCPGRPVTHLTIVADALAYALMIDAFEHDGAADPERLPDDVCMRGLVDEAGPADLLTPDMLFGFLDGTALDPDVPRSLLTAEEPELAPYAAAHADTPDQDTSEEDGHDEGVGSGEAPDSDQPSGDGDPTHPDGASPGTAPAGEQVAPLGASAPAGETLPATGSPLAGVGLALVGIAALARPRPARGRPTG